MQEGDIKYLVAPTSFYKIFYDLIHSIISLVTFYKCKCSELFSLIMFFL
jgi:hypothetical protein